MTFAEFADQIEREIPADHYTEIRVERMRYANGLQRIQWAIDVKGRLAPDGRVLLYADTLEDLRTLYAKKIRSLLIATESAKVDAQ